jgi:hypothetical protein
MAMLLLSIPSLTAFAQDSDEDEEESEDESTEEEELITHEESTTDEEELTYVPADESEVESTDEEQSTTDDDGLIYVPADEEPLCDPSYPDNCIPPPPPQLNCGDEGVPAAEFTVLPPDPHGFDDDYDGLGCESNVPEPTIPTEPIQPAPTSTTNPSNTTAVNTTDTTNSNHQESTTYSFKEVTFQGSHGWTSDSDGFSASTSGSFHPISSFDNPERTAQIEGTGRFEMTAHKKTANGDNCLYEIKGNYGVSGKVKYDNNTSSEHPNGILDVDSILIPAIYAPLKEGPKNACGEKYGFGYSPMLICNEPVTIDIAAKMGINERHREGENEVCTLELSGSKSPPAECPTVPESASAEVSAMVPVTTATEGNTCASPNNPPIAVAKWTAVAPNTAYVGDTLTLNGKESYDPDRDPIVQWKWTKTSPSDSMVPNTLSNPSSREAQFRLPDYIPAQFTSRTTPPNLLPIEFSLEVVDNRGMKSTNTDTSKVSIDIECLSGDLAKANNARDFFQKLINHFLAVGFPQTVDNFRYFLSGGGDIVGKPLEVSGQGVPDPLPVQWLDDAGEFELAQSQLVSKIEKDIKEMLKGMKVGETRTLPFDGSDGRYKHVIKSKNALVGTDFENAVGSAIAYAYPHLQITKTGTFSSDRASGNIQFKLVDTYDFNIIEGLDHRVNVPGIGSILSSDIHSAIKCLGARNFDQTTVYNKIITDMAVGQMAVIISIVPPVCPPSSQCQTEPY